MALNFSSLPISTIDHVDVAIEIGLTRFTNKAKQLIPSATTLQNCLAKVWSVVRARSKPLLNLAEISASCTLQDYSYLRRQTISLNQIRGSASQGRCFDFDADFRPLKAHNKSRWQGIAQARQRGVKLPPIILIQVGDLYFVEDGHHRISVAKALSDEVIEAQVTICQMVKQVPWQ